MIELPQRFRAEIIAHAREREPEEACGLIGVETTGNCPRVAHTYRARNIAESATVRFEVAPRDLLHVFKLEENSWGMGIYHSHPHSPAYPSPTDGGHARRWPGIYHFIASLKRPDAPEINAYRIEDDEIIPEKLRIVAD